MVRVRVRFISSVRTRPWLSINFSVCVRVIRFRGIFSVRTRGRFILMHMVRGRVIVTVTGTVILLVRHMSRVSVCIRVILGLRVWLGFGLGLGLLLVLNLGLVLYLLFGLGLGL